MLKPRIGRVGSIRAYRSWSKKKMQ